MVYFRDVTRIRLSIYEDDEDETESIYWKYFIRKKEFPQDNLSEKKRKRFCLIINLILEHLVIVIMNRLTVNLNLYFQ